MRLFTSCLLAVAAAIPANRETKHAALYAHYSEPHFATPDQVRKILAGVDRNCEALDVVASCCSCKKAVCMDEAANGGTCSDEPDASACCERHRQVCLGANSECTAARAQALALLWHWWAAVRGRGRQ